MVRTILVTIAASMIAGLAAHVVDQLLGLESLTRNWGGVGCLWPSIACFRTPVVPCPWMMGVLIRRSGLCHRRDFGGEVIFFSLEPFADHEVGL